MLKAQKKYEEAEPLYQRALKIRERIHGAEALGIVPALHDLALLYVDQAKYAKAEPLYLRSLMIREKVHGSEHVDVAQSLYSVAYVLAKQAKYAEAEPLYLRSLTIREKLLGPNHRDIAFSLLNLGILYRDQSRFAEAEPLFQRTVTIREKIHGPEHDAVAFVLSTLAHLYQLQTKYAEAEPLYERGLKIREKVHGPEHPDVAATLNNLAELYLRQAKYGEAESLYRRSLIIREKIHGPEHPEVAWSLNGLALTYKQQLKYAQVEPLLKRCLKIWEKAYGPEHPDVAAALINLANLYIRQSKYAEAEPLILRSLKIRENLHGPDHPRLIPYLNNLGELYLGQAKYAEAEPVYQLTLKINEQIHGPDHPAVAFSLHYLSEAYMGRERFAHASPLVDRARRSARAFYLRELTSISVAEQQRFLEFEEIPRFQRALTIGFRHSADSDLVSRSAEWLLNGKTLATEAQTLRTRIELEATGNQRDLLNQIQGLRSKEATLALGDAAKTATRRKELADRRHELEKRLAQGGGTAAKFHRLWFDLAEVRKHIPADGVLIDIARFRPARFAPKHKESHWDPARYVAWVIPPSGDVQIVDLGQAAKIDAAVKAARDVMETAPKRLSENGEAMAEAYANAVMQKLADLVLKPLAPQLKNVKSLIVSPDGELWLVPWAALPVTKGRYLIEDVTVRFVNCGRDLVPLPQAKITPTPPRVFADPDFDTDLRPDQSPGDGTRGRSRDASRFGTVGRLPGTAVEAEAITPKLAKLFGDEPEVFMDTKASEAAVRSVKNP